MLERAPLILFKGGGYVSDPGVVASDLLIHVATPTAVIREMNRFGFRVVERVRSDFPATSCLPPEWHYYACVKSAVFTGPDRSQLGNRLVSRDSS
jgi:hypothetical protein